MSKQRKLKQVKLTRENWGRKLNYETCEGVKDKKRRQTKDFLIFQFHVTDNEEWTWFKKNGVMKISIMTYLR